MLIPESEQRDLLIYAFRYTLGRATYAPHTVIAVLKKSWNNISQGDKRLYQREIKEAIEHDMAGHDLDKEEWSKILELDIA